MSEDRHHLERLGAVFYQRGLWFAAEESWGQWLAQTRVAADPAQEIRALNANGAAQLDLHRLEHGLALFQEAHRLIQVHARPALEQVKVLANLSNVHLLRAELPAALESGLEARDLCQRTDECPPFLRGHVEQTIATIYMDQGNWPEALAACREALAIYTDADDEFAASQMRGNLGLIQLEQGHYREAQEHLLAAVESVRAQSDPGKEASLCTELGRLSYRIDDIAAAVAYGSQALQVLWSNVAVMDKEEVARLSELFGNIAWLSGDRQAAVNDLQRASTYYAQKKMWRKWSAVNRQLDEWVRQKREPGQANVVVDTEAKERLRYFTTLLGLMDSLESLFPDLRGKADLSMQYALSLGDAVGLEAADREALSHAGRLHDVGLTSVDAEIVQGNQPLTDQARKRMQAHPLLGEQLLSLFPLPQACLAAVKHHHESYDGTGYPDGLSGDKIPLLARIIAVADAYVTFLLADRRSDEAGMPAPTHSQALQALDQRSGSVFDPEIVAAFVRMHQVDHGG